MPRDLSVAWRDDSQLIEGTIKTDLPGSVAQPSGLGAEQLVWNNWYGITRLNAKNNAKITRG